MIAMACMIDGGCDDDDVMGRAVGCHGLMVASRGRSGRMPLQLRGVSVDFRLGLQSIASSAVTSSSVVPNVISLIAFMMSDCAI